MYTQIVISGAVPERRLASFLERIRITAAPLAAHKAAIWNFLALFSLQFVFYAIVTVNTRAIAHASISGTVVTDGGLAALNWVTIRMIAKKTDSGSHFVGYLFGSIFGSTLGIPVSQYFLGF